MCWRSKRKSIVKKTAEEDISTFKIALLTSDNDILSYYRHFKYELNKIYNIPELKIININNIVWHYEIAKGFHSYSKECSISNDVDVPYIFYVKFENRTLDSLGCPLELNNNKAIMLNCIIPKGSQYYLNEKGEFVSNQIKIISIEDVLDRS